MNFSFSFYSTLTWFIQYVKDSPENAENEEFAAAQMAEKLGHNPELCEKLIPKWQLGCRRITPGEGYLEAFLRPNVHLIQSSIKQITTDSVIAEDGKEHKVDVSKYYYVYPVRHRLYTD